MYELINRFIGKECIITVMNGPAMIEATIKEVKDNWVVIDNGNGDDILNLDFITRIREYPRKPNGKKKAFFA